MTARFSSPFLVLTLAAALGATGLLAGCNKALVSNSLQGKTFAEGDGTSFMSFDSDQATYTVCSSKSEVILEILGKTYPVELTADQLQRGFRTMITRNSYGVQMKCFVEPEDKWRYTSAGSLTSIATGESLSPDVVVSDTLSSGDVATLSASEILQSAVWKDGASIESESERLALFKSGSDASDFEAASLVRTGVNRITSPNTCVDVLKMPYVIRDGAVAIEWRNAKTPSGSDPYKTRSSGRSVAEMFGFNSSDEAWSVVVEGEAYTRQDTSEGQRVETAIRRANSLPASGSTLNESGI